MNTGNLKLRLGLVAVVLAWLCADSFLASAQRKEEPAAAERSGRNFIPTPVFSVEEDQKVLSLFEGLRVSDVVDGMDQAGLAHIGRMSPAIRPLWKDLRHFKHRFVGIAVTARYVPTNQGGPGRLDPDGFDRWMGKWYGERSSEPFVTLIRKGTALVIEDSEEADVGTIGSNNILSWKLKGCAGVVTSAGARDSDEVSIEEVPLYFKSPGRGIRPGRNEIESVNRPIVCGGALVIPGDVVVADGDGVVVVPRASAEEVARYARKTLEGDKAGRRELYRKLGLPEDDSVK